MDPIALATITSGVTVLATEAGKGLAGEMGKDAWTRIKSVLGFQADPPAGELAPAVAERLANDDAAAREVLRLLREHAGGAGGAAAIVGQVNAERVVVIKDQKIQGDFNLNM
jgi:hypothetical protein